MLGRFGLTMKKALNLKEISREIANKRAKKNHQGKNHWHINKRSNIIVCKFCDTSIPIWKNPKFCPNCLEGKDNESSPTFVGFFCLWDDRSNWTMLNKLKFMLKRNTK